jgi:ribosomal protein S6
MSDESRTYELGYIIVPTVSENDVAEKVAALKSAITAVQGTVGAEGNPEFIDLAYQIEKNVKSKKMKWSQGYFGWIKFDAAPETLEALKKAYDANEDLARYMLIKSSAENTVIFKKPKAEAKRGGDTVEDVVFSEEELAAANEDVVEPEAQEDIQESHEKLPDLQDDMTTEA